MSKSKTSVPSGYKVGNLLYMSREQEFFKIIKINPKSVTVLAYESDIDGDRTKAADGTVSYAIKCSDKHPKYRPIASKLIPGDKPFAINYDVEKNRFYYRGRVLKHYLPEVRIRIEYNPLDWP